MFLCPSISLAHLFTRFSILHTCVTITAKNFWEIVRCSTDLKTDVLWLLVMLLLAGEMVKFVVLVCVHLEMCVFEWVLCVCSYVCAKCIWAYYLFLPLLFFGCCSRSLILSLHCSVLPLRWSYNANRTYMKIASFSSSISRTLNERILGKYMENVYHGTISNMCGNRTPNDLNQAKKQMAFIFIRYRLFVLIFDSGATTYTYIPKTIRKNMTNKSYKYH